MGVSTSRPLAQVGNWGERESSPSSVGLVGGLGVCHTGVTPKEQPTAAVLNLLALLSWAAFRCCLCFLGRIFKGREHLETEKLRFIYICMYLFIFTHPAKPLLGPFFSMCS